MMEVGTGLRSMKETISSGHSGLTTRGGVSVAIPHENIALGQWHQVTGTYDGQYPRFISMAFSAAR